MGATRNEREAAPNTCAAFEQLLDRYEDLWRERVERMDQLISGSPEVGDR